MERLQRELDLLEDLIAWQEKNMGTDPTNIPPLLKSYRQRRKIINVISDYFASHQDEFNHISS
ncbi:MAG TPA: hypothetical protein VEP90_26790 [Methylomirabilota bacterium]|nr:hypothetical protein [Methylomirabilota bacterium]